MEMECLSGNVRPIPCMRDGGRGGSIVELQQIPFGWISKRDSKQEVHIPARLCLRGSSSASPWSWRIWKNNLKHISRYWGTLLSWLPTPRLLSITPEHRCRSGKNTTVVCLYKPVPQSSSGRTPCFLSLLVSLLCRSCLETDTALLQSMFSIPET